MNLSNLFLFGLHFLAYAFVFVLIVALVVLACFIGIKWRKSKDAKMAAEAEKESNIEA